MDDRRGADTQTEQGHSLDGEMNRRIVRSSAWVGLGVGGGQIVSFVSTLVLVRLLAPNAFGTVAIGMTLLTVIGRVQESGLGAALVNTRRHDPTFAASSVFVFAAVAGFALAGLAVGVAPVYTRLLHSPESTRFVQALAPVLALRGLSIVPSSMLERRLDFRSLTQAQFYGMTVQAAVAIGCAFAGMGAWSLIVGTVAGSIVQTSSVWLRAGWRPAPSTASRRLLRDMLRYGRFISLTNVMLLINTNVDTVTVARFLGAGPLGVYNVAWRLAGLPTTFIGVIVGRVMFSVYSRLQHDLAAVRAGYIQNMQRTMLLALPVTVTLGIAARPIVLGLLGSKWEGAVDPLRILAVFGLQRLLSGPSGELFKGIGRPHLALIGSGTFFVATVPTLIYLVPRHGSAGAALGMTLGGLVSGTIILGLTFRVLELRPSDFARALARPVGCAMLVAAALLVTLPAADSLSVLPALGVIVVVASGTFLVALALLGRPLLTPIWSALRRT